LFRSPFRQKALDRLSSPEQLDQMVRVIPGKGWLALLALVVLLGAVITWAITATLQLTVFGDGIITGSVESPQTLEAVLFVSIDDGLRIQPGMRAQISPNSVHQEEYGLMWGKVAAVRGVPSTADEMLQVLGNDSLVSALNAEGKLVEVRIQLDMDENTPSGYFWTSVSGPPYEIHSGTLGDGVIVVDQQRPIELVLP
jgi:hypothetical protein